MGSMNFVEEIEYNEIKVLEVVGKGSFGVVNKAKWRDKIVAVKMINSELERKAFLVELRQLSRVDHPNIVKLYGACQTKPVCLVMEYAEGGSLYNVLHGNLQPEYSAAHAISWALQCSRGVAYLHGMKPKALIHRDLKPPNLLLIMGGTVLKICDFGTACDIQTHMTNNKGSAAWMAPEVFEGSKYSEKCDVFSWGIILWEVISRQKPFDDIRGSAYQILWAVHSGKRPPLIKRCPKPLEILMTRCWAKEPHLRPSMDEVVNIMTHLFVFFKGAEQPIKYPEQTDGLNEDYDSDESGESYDSREVTYGSDNISHAREETSSSDQSTQKDTSAGSVETLANTNSSQNLSPMILSSRISITSAPASIVGSLEDLLQSEKTLGSEINANRLLDKVTDPPPKVMHGHKRSGSYGSNFVPETIPEINVVNGEIDKRRNSDAGSKYVQSKLNRKEEKSPAPAIANWYPENPPNMQSAPLIQSSLSLAPALPSVSPSGNDALYSCPLPSITPLEPSRDTLDNAYRLLEPHLQPIAPQQNSKESMRIFEEHKKYSYELAKYKSELELLRHRKAELIKQMSGPLIKNALPNDFDNLSQEKEGLQKLYANLEQQLAITRKQLHS